MSDNKEYPVIPNVIKEMYGEFIKRDKAFPIEVDFEKLPEHLQELIEKRKSEK